MSRFTRIELCTCAVSVMTVLASCGSPFEQVMHEQQPTAIATVRLRANDCKAPNSQSTQRGCKALVKLDEHGKGSD